MSTLPKSRPTQTHPIQRANFFSPKQITTIGTGLCSISPDVISPQTKGPVCGTAFSVVYYSVRSFDCFLDMRFVKDMLLRAPGKNKRFAYRGFSISC